MGFSGVELSNCALGGGKIEQVLRKVGPGRYRAAEQVFRSPVLPEQAEHAAERIQAFGRGSRHPRGSLRSLDGQPRLSGDKQAFRAENMWHSLVRKQRYGAIGGCDRRIGAITA